ncbi:MAG: oxidoreductase, partial [Anaeromyxobacteraceae bacterium]
MGAATKRRSGLDPAEVEIALRVLSEVARDRTVLAALGAEVRVALQRLAGEVARPDLKARKKLQKALLRQEKVGKKSRDAALRGATGIQELRRAAVFATPLPALPAPGSAASGWWPRLPGPPDAP